MEGGGEGDGGGGIFGEVAEDEGGVGGGDGGGELWGGGEGARGGAGCENEVFEIFGEEFLSGVGEEGVDGVEGLLGGECGDFEGGGEGGGVTADNEEATELLLGSTPEEIFEERVFQVLGEMVVFRGI